MAVADTQLQNLIKITKVRKESNYEHSLWRPVEKKVAIG